MNENINFIWAAGALVLAVSALVAQRAPVGTVVKSLIAWAAIIGIIVAAMMHREQIETVVVAVADRFGLSDQKVVGDTVRISMSEDGHFWARAKLNGYSKRMLIDSGATITAISDATARNAGIDVSASAMPVTINTANGSVSAARGTAGHVSIGALDTRDLGVVVSPAFGDTDVLGMNFLSRLGSWRVEGRTLILEPKREGQKTPADTDA